MSELHYSLLSVILVALTVLGGLALVADGLVDLARRALELRPLLLRLVRGVEIRVAGHVRAPAVLGDLPPRDDRRRGWLRRAALVGLIVLGFAVVVPTGPAPAVVPDISLPPFEVSSQSTFIDLRDWKPVPDSDRPKKIWADKTRTRLVVRRLTDSAKNLEHVLGTDAAGAEPTIYCRAGLACSLRPTQERVMRNTRTWIFSIDLSDSILGSDIDVEYFTEVWNGFSGKTNEWAAVMVENPTRRLEIEIAFPSVKPAKNFKYMVRSHVGNTKSERIDSPDILEEGSRSAIRRVKWTIASPQIGSFYEIDWDW